MSVKVIQVIEYSDNSKSMQLDLSSKGARISLFAESESEETDTSDLFVIWFSFILH